MKNTDKVISLLKEIINIDIIYCLKINNDPDFNGIRPQIEDIYKEIRSSQNEKLKREIHIFDKKTHNINLVVNKIHESDYMISHDFNVELLQQNRDELSNMLNFNSILNIFIIDYCFSQLSIFLHQDLKPLLIDCKKIGAQLKTKKKDVANRLLKAKKNSRTFRLFIYLILSQLFAIPFGIVLELSKSVLIYQAGIAVSYFLVLQVRNLRPRLKLSKLHSNLQMKEQDMDKMITIIEKILSD